MATLIVGSVVFGCIGLAMRNVYRSAKQSDTCGCGCSSCDKVCSINAHQQ